MPHLQAVVRPLRGKNWQKTLILQVERKIIALLLHDFSPLSSITIEFHQPTAHAKAVNKA